MRLVQVRFHGLPVARDIELEFPLLAGGGLHILYGPNEAGKSTLLRALLDLWFGGASARERYTAQTRLQAVLERGGERRSVGRRLYRNQLALRDGDLVDEAELREWLGGFDAASFRLWWAFDHDRLRAGSDTLLDVRGEAGASLFSAGGGVQHLRQVQADVERRLAELLDPRFARNSVKTLNRALRDLEQAEQALRTQALRPEAWRRVRAELERLKEELSAAQARRQTLETEVRRLERIQRAAPLAAQHEALSAELAALDDASAWSAEEAEAVLADLAEADRLAQDIRLAEARLEAARRALAASTPDAAVWAEADEIDRLSEGLEGYVRLASEEVPQRAAELAATRLDLERRLTEIDPTASWTEADRLFLPAAVVETARQVAEAKAAAERDLSHEQQRLAEADEEVRRHEAERERLTAPGDVESLRAVLAAARAMGDVDAQLAKMTEEERALAQAMADRLAAQTLWSGPPDALAALPVPLRETVERYAAAFEALRDEERAYSRRAEELAREERALAEAVADLEREGPLPTEDRLAALRGARDALWQAIRALWLGEAVPQDVWEAVRASAAALEPGTAADVGAGHVARSTVNSAAGSDGAPAPDWAPRALAERYEQALRAADETADALRRESQRVARWLQHRSQLERVRQELAQVREALARLRDQEAELEAAWRGEWAAAGVEPRTPAEMKEWLQAVYQPLLETWRSLEARRAERRALAARREQDSECLCKALIAAGAPEASVKAAADHGWLALLEFADGWLRQCDQRRAQAAAVTRALEAARERRQEAERRAAAAQAALDAANEVWRVACEPYPHLPADVRAAVRVIDHITALQADIGRWRVREQQLRDDKARVAAYEAQVAALAARLGEPAPAGSEVAHRVRAWRNRLAEARQLHGRQTEVRRQIDELTQTLADHGARLAVIRERLEQARVRAGCDTDAALAEAARRAKTRAGLLAERDRLREQLSAVADGEAWEAVIAEVAAGPGGAELADLLARRREERTGVDAAIEELQHRIGELRQQLRDTEAHTLDASTAAQRAESAFAQVDAAWQQWLRLYVADKLLRRGMEEFRERTEARVLAEAGRALDTLTRGRYTAVEVDWEGSQAYLVAVGADGRRRPDELSDGTRDQLFLALRLAFLARHLEDGEALPVVMDDVFVHFDDARTEAALTALAGLGERTQVLYLTHHRAVAVMGERLQQQGLPVVVHELAGP